MNDAQTADLFLRLERIEETLARMATPKPQEWLTSDAACEYAGMSINTLRSYCNKGLLKYSKMGRKLIINRDSLLEYISTRSTKTIKERVKDIIR